MAKTNGTLWVKAEELGIAYAKETNQSRKEDIFKEFYENMKTYLRNSIDSAFSKASLNGLNISKEDFESRYFLHLWEAIESYEIGGESTLRNIVITRIRFAEAQTIRPYQSKGHDGYKNGIAYFSARLDSLDRKINNGGEDENDTLGEIVASEMEVESAEEEFLENYEVNEILKDFALKNERHANVIRFMYLGYEGNDLAVATGESDTYDAKMRKLVERAKKSFAKFMTERGTNL